MVGAQHGRGRPERQGARLYAFRQKNICASPVQLAEAVAPAMVVVLPLVQGWHWGLGATLVPPADQVPRGHIVHGLPPLPLAQIAAQGQVAQMVLR